MRLPSRATSKPPRRPSRAMSSKVKACAGRVAAWATTLTTNAGTRRRDRDALMARDITQVLRCRREQERPPDADGPFGSGAGARRGAGAVRPAGTVGAPGAAHLG